MYAVQTPDPEHGRRDRTRCTPDDGRVPTRGALGWRGRR
jgi:hypothetical protein